MRRYRFLCILCVLCMLPAAIAHATGDIDALQYGDVPRVLRPGKYYDVTILTPEAGMGSLQLMDGVGSVVYSIYAHYPLAAGQNVLSWDGLRADQSVIQQGEYTLRFNMDAGGFIDTPLRVGVPYPLITDIQQSSPVIHENKAANIAFRISEPGTLHVRIISYVDGSTYPLATLTMSAGENSIQWQGMVDNARMPAGRYALEMILRTETGESVPQNVLLEVAYDAPATPSPSPEPTATPEPTPTPAPTISQPYSSIDDGTFWSMTPGELDDAVIWEILTQPITVYDGGLDAKPKIHAYMMENPDGTGAQVAQLHAQSQALHVIGEPNEYGYVLVEAFSNYDENYNPKTDEERAHAFDLKQGYVLAEHLKTVEVKQDIGFVVDKLTQRMYMFVDGERVTEFLIATGKIEDGKYYNETIAGEYITISHTGGFWSGNMYCDMAIRINGGILLHEVPFKENADGTKNYASFEGYLGTKQSHGCIRVQRLKTPEGYNHRWLWENLDRKGGYKVIIWDDLNRYDTPTTWQENPKN